MSTHPIPRAPGAPRSAPAPAAPDPRAAYWVHWHYAAAEWQAWIDRDLVLARRKWMNERVAAALAGLILLFLATMILWSASSRSALWLTLVTLLVAGLAILAGAL